MVVDDADRARDLCAGGHDVVVVVAPDAPVWVPVGPGRSAVFVGTAGSASDRAGAAEMAAELFSPATSSGPGSAPG